ncbi:MAG TPA: efflux RND transporter permease subunit [Candidatus Acidoferrum sp.]|jgi:multidrug efflux pump subunit AcrB|nr:efflux RND transporter permease subunit [Candidatus Acidoferrum sp.]
MSKHVENKNESGGLAQFCVEHREVSWLALIAVLVWGAVAYTRLGQQEDPTIPQRTAMLVTVFPGATASKVEELVSKPLERKISELKSIEEIKSTSRPGISTMTIKQLPGSTAAIDQEWDKVRAKLFEVQLPDGARQPWLNTDFGNTITLLFGLVSPPINDAECMARANVLRQTLAELRKGVSSANHAAVAAFFPPSISQSYRETLRGRFETAIRSTNLAKDVQTIQGQSFILVDLDTPACRADLERFVADFTRTITGTDRELFHPDFTPPLLLMGDEDPLPQIRASAPPRYSYRTLELLARDFEDTLKQVESVGKVTKVAIVQEAAYLLFSDANIAGYGLTPDTVMGSIGARNAVIPGGTMRTEGRNFPVQLSGEYKTERDMLGTMVGMNRAGAPVYLRDAFEVRRMYESPIPYQVDVLGRTSGNGPLDTRRAVMVAVEMRDGKIIRHFNEDVIKVVETMKARMPEGLEFRVLSDQPTAVEHRIHHFVRCFIEAVVIVIIVGLFLMDWRSALVLATAVPLTVAMTLIGMQLLHIPLQQISIASLIIALGMLVDVPVVASDGINRELHKGEPRLRAAWLGPLHLRHPMVFGTLINIFAFLPLLLLTGDKGEFMKSLPNVITISLLAALLVSVTFTPLISYYVLRGQKGFDEGGEVRSFFLFRYVDKTLMAVLPHYRAALEKSLKRPLLVLGIGYSVLAASCLLVPLLGSQFFPPAERNQLLVDIELPSSDSLTSMRTTVAQAVALIKGHEEVLSAAVFSGGTAPRFYYNVEPKEPANYLAQILINTRHADDVTGLLVKLRQELDKSVPGARCVVKQLEQGPPVAEPIQIRISGENLDKLRLLADQAAAELRAAGGYHVFDDLGLHMPNIQIDIDQDRANSLGLNNKQIGNVAQASFTGLKVTELREGDRLIPVLIRGRIEDRSEAEKIRGLYVQTPDGKSVPFESFSTLKVQPEFVTIPHYNQLRTVTVKAYAPFGELPSQILDRARAGLAKIKLDPGYELKFAGEDKELRENKGEMGRVMLISLALIALTMVLQFSSVIKSVVVMLTVPLGLIGAVLGLFVTHSPLGFMALLAMVSLAGIMVSHIIVLSDFIEEARAKGLPLEQALVQAGLARLRPVLVTVLATVGGLIPLFLTGGALWHPLTAVHIVGLLLATVLTLVMLPTLYYVFCAKLKFIK